MGRTGSIVLLLSALLSIHTTIALGAASDYSWEQFYRASVINSIVSQGSILWIGTDKGLMKLDKATLSLQHLNNSNSGLSANYVSAIYNGHDQILWFGVIYSFAMGYEAPSICKFAQGNWAGFDSSQFPTPYMRQGQTNKITSIITDAHSDVWIAMNAKDLLRYHNNSWITVDTLNKLRPSIAVSSLTVDSNGVIWAATNRGLACISDQKVAFFDTLNSSIPGNTISAVAVDTKNVKWLISCKGGLSFPPSQVSYFLSSYNDTGWVSYPILQSSPYQIGAAPVGSSLIIDKHNKKWIAVNGKALWALDGTIWTVLDSSNSMGAIATVGQFSIDTNDVIWIAATGDTLLRYTGQNHQKICLSNLDGFDNYGKVVTDTQGNVWVVSNDKISIFKNGSWVIKPAPQPRKLSMRAAAIDKNNNLWVGYYDQNNGGVARYDGSVWQLFNSATSNLQSNYINAIFCDHKGAVWIGTDKGPARFNGSGWDIFDSVNYGYTGYQTYAFAETKDHKMVFGCGRGAYIYDGATWTKIADLPGIIYCNICTDSSGKLWFTPYTCGIAVYDGQKVTWMDTTNSPVPNNQVMWITIDEFDNKWISTWNGLAKLSGNTWDIFTDYNSGLPHNSTGHSVVDGSGRLWLETNGGLVLIGKKGQTKVLHQPLNRKGNSTAFVNAGLQGSKSSVFTLLGQKILTDHFNNKLSSSLPSGIYIVNDKEKNLKRIQNK